MLFHELLSCPCNWFNAHGVKTLIKCHRGAPLSSLPSLSLGIGCIVTESGICNVYAQYCRSLLCK